MGLKINTNVDSMRAHRFLSQNDAALAKSMEKLSSGLAINSAADEPAALVISENMRGQISGINQATKNNETAISLLQTAEGALTEVNRLLIDIRQRAIHAANEGINDDAMLQANQAEIENALATIDRIALNTQFGHSTLLDGTRTASGDSSSPEVEFISADAQAKSSQGQGYEVKIFEMAKKANYTSATALTQEMINAGEKLTIREGGREATYTTSFGETIKGAIESFAAIAKRSGLNVSISGDENGIISISHTEFGKHDFQISSTSAGLLSESSGKEVNVSNGADIRASINGESTIGEGNFFVGKRGNKSTDGLRLFYRGDVNQEVDDVNGTEFGFVKVDQGALRFQVGANKDQTVSVNLLNTSSTQIGRNVENESGFTSLADIDVRTANGAQDTIGLVDRAIEEISANRGALGAFQKNTLESNLMSLRIASENLTAAESTIRDVDIAAELANYTKNQIMLQSATAQMAQANSSPQTVFRLLGVA